MAMYPQLLYWESTKELYYERVSTIIDYHIEAETKMVVIFQTTFSNAFSWTKM